MIVGLWFQSQQARAQDPTLLPQTSIPHFQENFEENAVYFTNSTPNRLQFCPLHHSHCHRQWRFLFPYRVTQTNPNSAYTYVYDSFSSVFVIFVCVLMRAPECSDGQERQSLELFSATLFRGHGIKLLVPLNSPIFL